MGVAARLRVGIVAGGDRHRIVVAVRAVRDRGAPARGQGGPVPDQRRHRRVPGAQPPLAWWAERGAVVRGGRAALTLLAVACACTTPIDAGGAAPSDAASAGDASAGAGAAPNHHEGFASYHPYDDVPGINVACSPAASTEFDPKNFD